MDGPDGRRGYKQVARAWLFAARESWDLPVLSRGLLYVVQNTRDTLHATSPRLLCYDLAMSVGAKIQA